jgi:hypothetical protein
MTDRMTDMRDEAGNYRYDSYRFNIEVFSSQEAEVVNRFD